MTTRFSLAAVCIALFSGAAHAQIPDDLVDVTIIAGWREDDGSHIAGLAIRMAPGWKTYWRAPGEGGIPPMFDWSGSDNISDVSVHFPVPNVYYINGLRSIGYDSAVLFPLIIGTDDAAAPIRLKGDVEIGVCEEICIPVSFSVDTLLPATGEHSATLDRVLQDRPKAGSAMTCEVEPIADGLKLHVTIEHPPLGNAETAIVEASEPGLWVSPATVTRDGNLLSAIVEMVPPTAKPFALARSDVRLTILSDGQAVETLGCEAR